MQYFEVVVISDCLALIDRNNSSVSSEQTFLQRFLDNGATGSSTTNGSNDFVKSGLCSQQTSTAEILKLLVQSIDYEQVRNEELLSTFLNGIASNGEKFTQMGTLSKCCH